MGDHFGVKNNENNYSSHFTVKRALRRGLHSLPHCPSRGCKPNKPTTTTTDSPTTPDYQDSTTAEEAGNVDDRAAIREKTSEECANLEALEQLAFENCHRAADGFSWEEVEDCKEKFKDMSFEFAMPSKADFDAMEASGNNDGMLTMQEWKNYIRC